MCSDCTPDGPCWDVPAGTVFGFGLAAAVAAHPPEPRISGIVTAKLEAGGPQAKPGQEG